MTDETPERTGAEPSVLDVERHPVFDTWQNFGANDTADNGTEKEWPGSFESASLAEPLGPLNWNTLTADEAETEWHDINAWVHWLRGTYGLAPNDVTTPWPRPDDHGRDTSPPP